MPTSFPTLNTNCDRITKDDVDITSFRRNGGDKKLKITSACTTHCLLSPLVKRNPLKIMDDTARSSEN